MEISLDRLRPGMNAQVTEIACKPALCKRMADFGLVEGTKLECCYRSGDGGVVALRLRGSTIAIRRGDLRRCRGRLL